MYCGRRELARAAPRSRAHLARTLSVVLNADNNGLTANKACTDQASTAVLSLQQLQAREMLCAAQRGASGPATVPPRLGGVLW